MRLGRRTWLQWYHEDTGSTHVWSLKLVHNKKGARRG
jgi:hypothetical protein